MQALEKASGSLGGQKSKTFPVAREKGSRGENEVREVQGPEVGPPNHLFQNNILKAFKSLL